MINDLPRSIAIAIKAINLDNIKIVPVDTDTGIKHSISVFNIFRSEKRLIQKAANIVNADIKAALAKNKDSVFYVYMVADICYKNLFVTKLNMHYDIK